MNELSKSKSLAIVAVALLACAASAAAFGHAVAPRAAAADSGKRLLEQASKALGEDKPWTTRVEKGLHIEWDTEGWGTLRAAYTRSLKKPDKLVIDRDNSAYGHPFFRTYYYNGDDSWYMVNLNTGRSPAVAASMKTLIDRADGIASYLAACDTFFTEAPPPADTLLPGAKLERAGCVLAGDTTLFDIDAKTHLLWRRIENKGARVSIFDDYRKDDGRMIPFHVTVYDAGKKTNEFMWDTVTYNVPLDDAIFEENRPPKP